MSKFIIENKSNMNDISVFNTIKKVIQKGRISNCGKQYCYLTVIDGVRVLSRLNKQSDGFVVIDKEFGT